MNLIQTAGISLLVLIIGGWIYTRCHGDGVRTLTKLPLLVNALLLFVTLNLYYAAKNEIAVKEVIETYSVASTDDLLALMHEPFFHIIDQGKMMQMTKELPNQLQNAKR